MTIIPVFIFISVLIISIISSIISKSYKPLMFFSIVSFLLITIVYLSYLKFSNEKYLMRTLLKIEEKNFYEYEIILPFEGEYLFSIILKDIKKYNEENKEGIKVNLEIKDDHFKSILNKTIELKPKEMLNNFHLVELKMKKNKVYVINLNVLEGSISLNLQKPFLEISSNYYL